MIKRRPFHNVRRFFVLEDMNTDSFYSLILLLIWQVTKAARRKDSSIAEWLIRPTIKKVEPVTQIAMKIEEIVVQDDM